jgi:hypothetical protein
MPIPQLRPLRRLLLVLAMPAAAALGLATHHPASAAAQGLPIKFFETKGDKVHESSTPPPEMSGHGWWIRFSGPARQAVVTVQIQQMFDGGFVNVGRRGRARIRPGGGRGRRVTARARCHHYKGGRYTYRSVVDTDIVGHRDTPEKLYTNWATTSCSALGKDA